MKKSKKEPIKFNLKKLIITSVIAVVCICGLITIMYARQLFGDEVGDSLYGVGVENGFVAIGKFFNEKIPNVISTAITIALSFLIWFILYFLINVCLRKNARQKTIGSLLKSLLKYSIIVVNICVILGIWGVNVAGIFAGVGVLTLVIGLGCKSLVNDVVSGFFIVVDNYYQVGEKVTIDGFTGIIFSVGLRTTKIKDWMGNVKSINNSCITTVINLSRYKSMVEVTMDISYNEDLVRVEGVIAKNVDAINAKLPEINNSFAYKGVNVVGSSSITLYFLAECNESDRHTVRRELNRILYLLFKENDILIPFNQIVVNPQDPASPYKAEPKDFELSEELRGRVKKEEVKKPTKSSLKHILVKNTEKMDEE